MADALALAKLWADGLVKPDDGRDAIAVVLADDVSTSTPLGKTDGKDAVLEAFGKSQLAPFIERGTWSEPVADGEGAVVVCTFAPGAPVGGIRIKISVDGANHISNVETTMLPAAPPKPVAIALTDSIRAAVNGALVSGTPVMVAYVDTDGRPHMSLRGTVQVFSEDQLAMWIRNPEGGLLAAIPNNPFVNVFYRSPATRTNYQFHGRARVQNDDETRDRVYENSPEQERMLDAQKRGVAVVIDLDRVEGREAGAPVLMVRE